MKFNLPRQTIGKKLKAIISKELKKQKTDLVLATKDTLKELAQVERSIRKNGLPSYLVCKKLPHKLGKGIFLHPEAEPILRDQVIGSYTGEVSIMAQTKDEADGSYAFVPLENILLTKKEQLLIDEHSSYHPKRLYYLKIDALKKGNFTRFINHSEKPNLVAHLFKIPRNRYGVVEMPVAIIYLAKKKIHPGEQLLICYEDEEKCYWGVSKIKPFEMTPKTFLLGKNMKVVQS